VTFAGKTVLEVGPGNQLFTAFHYLEEGAGRVLVADPKVDPGSLARQLSRFNARSETPLAVNAASRIEFFRDVSEVPAAYDGRIDLICSHNVLEHIEDLESFYRDNARLLAPNGEAWHRVDVSDHTYHLFSRFPPLRALGHRRSLYHLRYSERAFRTLGDAKTYMNRRLLPLHREWIRKADLRISGLSTTPFPPVPIHPDLLKGVSPVSPDDLYLTDFLVKLVK
jgi:SAM-dependent methyltransferase